MNKTKLFIENFVIYGIGGVLGKLIPLIMIPVITRILPNSSYFGINDNTTSLVSITSYIALMGMYDAMYRMFFDSDDIEYRKKICSTTFFYTFILSFVVFLFMVIMRNKIASLFYDDPSFEYVVIIAAFSTLFGTTNAIVSGPARMQNKRLIYIIMNTIGPLISYTLALPLIFKGYYIIALPLANLVSTIINESVFILYNREWFQFKYIDIRRLKPLLTYAIPLIPNFLIYWIFNSCDRLMITNMIGIQAAGLYGIGSKLGSVSQLIYTAFAGGWAYFAFSTMRDKNQVKDNSKIFEYLGIISFVATIWICAFSYFIYDILFTEEYLESYIIAPYLFSAPLCQMLFQVAMAQFAIIKKTWPNMLILSSGATLNIFLNWYLIPTMGVEGAAIATLIGYVAAVGIGIIVISKTHLLQIDFKFWLSSIAFSICFVIWRIFFSKSLINGTLLAICLCLLFVFMYSKDLYVLINNIKNRRK